MPGIDKLIAFENGDLSQEETIVLFQDLVNSGLAWQLQGIYGRTAKALIATGEVHMPIQTVSNAGEWPAGKTRC